MEKKVDVRRYLNCKGDKVKYSRLSVKESFLLSLEDHTKIDCEV
jgi:hypothetical protein